MSYFVFLVALLSQDPVVRTREPRAASDWVQSVEGRCADVALTVQGFGGGTPPGRTATLLSNGRTVRGEGIDRLLADLSNRRAAYRLSLLCGDIPDHISIRFYEGEAQPDGSVRFRSGSATIRGGRLEAYTGLEAANAETFWFR